MFFYIVMNVMIGFSKTYIATLNLEEDYLNFYFLKHVRHVKKFQFCTSFFHVKCIAATIYDAIKLFKLIEDSIIVYFP